MVMVVVDSGGGDNDVYHFFKVSNRVGWERLERLKKALKDAFGPEEFEPESGLEEDFDD